MLTEIINKVKDPPPLCRPIISVEEAPVEVIQLMKQAWSEDPDKRPTFEDIFKQVKIWKYVNLGFYNELKLTGNQPSHDSSSTKERRLIL